jgi:hypothetical protein
MANTDSGQVSLTSTNGTVCVVNIWQASEDYPDRAYRRGATESPNVRAISGLSTVLTDFDSMMHSIKLTILCG